MSTGNYQDRTMGRGLGLITLHHSTYLVPYIYMQGPEEPFPFPQFPIPTRVILPSVSALGCDLDSVLHLFTR